MLVDMHLHECTYSTDSFLHLEEIVSIARQKGLDAICITDHDSMGLRERAEAYSREIGYPIFVGVEFFRSGAISPPGGSTASPTTASAHRTLSTWCAKRTVSASPATPFAATIAGCASTCAMCTVLTAWRSSTAARRLRRTGRHCASAASWGSRPSARATRTCRSRWEIRDMAARNGHNAARFCHRAAHAGNASRHLDGQRVRCRHRVLR